jgi:phenylalanyl-tRNA synthetase beta chain
MGGEVYEVIVDYEGQKNHTPDLEYKKMKLDLEKMNKILGVKIKEKDVQEMLKRMGYGYKAKEKTVLIPPYRADVMDEIDIIEDIAIVYGYNKFEPTIPNFFYPGKKSSQYKDVGSSMQRMGFVEINTPVLTSRERLEQFGCKGIDVLNPKTNEYTTIRSNLVPNMVEVIARNKMKGLPQKFYEIGSIVDPTSKQEKKAFCFGVTDKKLEFSSVRGYLQGIAQLLGGKIELKAVKHVSYEEPYSLDILKDGKKIGAFGKLNKRIMDSFGLEFPVFVVYLELNA